MWFSNIDRRARAPEPAKLDLGKSILSMTEVQRSIVNGAPPVPWQLKPEDRETMQTLATYFAKAIPVPTEDGRVTVTETIGYGGPQLELYVPVLSCKNPVAVLVRNWHAAGSLEADLHFFGAPDGRLAAILTRLGFKKRGDLHYSGTSVYQNAKPADHKRAS